MKTVDARGLSCPQPMLMAKTAMQAGDDDKIEVLVDCEASVENVTRAAGKLGWKTGVTREGDDIRLELVKN